LIIRRTAPVRDDLVDSGIIFLDNQLSGEKLVVEQVEGMPMRKAEKRAEKRFCMKGY
jgi:hypothetical protein